MRVPIGWLREFVDIDPDTSLDSIHAALVRVGFEEEAVHVTPISGPVVVGRVLDATPEPQTNGKTINWCHVDVGPGAEGAGRDVRGIVCGAHNFAAGDLVVVSLPGAVLPGPFPISARKTYGHVSDGMIASARELGLGDEHEGILRLASLGVDAEPGDDAIGLLHLDDAAVEINVTPDRGYALSLRGVAREYGHSTGAAFRDPALAVGVREVPPTGFEVRIDDDAPIRGRAAVTAFETRVVRGIDAGRPTPPYIVSRLALAGVRSISLVVDVTNYVMLELGQPIHGYDLDRVDGGLVVRRAEAGERLVTLDDRDRALHPEDLVIADGSGAIGLAGVMGGASTEIGAGTRDVLVEAANFDPVSVARTARRHRLPSEASRRFERGVDPAVAPAAAQRVVDLLVRLAGGTADPLGSSFAAEARRDAIRLPEGYVTGLVGADFTAEEIRGALDAVGCRVTDVDGALQVVPPTWRPDLADAADLTEEVARLVGYDRIPSVLPTAPPGRGLTRTQRLRRAVAVQLAAGGATEVLSSPFASRAAIDRVSPGATAVRLANPLDAETPLLRVDLLPGLLDVARRNLSRGLIDLDLYEIGTVFRPRDDRDPGSDSLPPGGALPAAATLAALNDGIPPQPRHVGGLLLGDAVPRRPAAAREPVSLAHALDAVRRVAAALGVTVEVRQGAHPALHPGRAAQVIVDGESAGWAGEVLPALTAELDLPRVVAAWELDLDALVRLAPEEVQARPVVTSTAATQDLSLVVPRAVPAGEVLASVREGAAPLLEHAALVDDYRGEGVGDEEKSLTFALRFRAPDRTLTAQEATAAKLAGAALAGERHGATVRE